MDGKLAKASLTLHKPANGGRGLGAEIENGKFEFSFNPKEFTVQRSAEWKVKNGKTPSPPEYNGAKGGTITIEMFLDRSEDGKDSPKVSDVAAKLMAAVMPIKGGDANKPVAPYATFSWGGTDYVHCATVKTVAVKYTRFASSGEAIRAVVTLTLEEVLAVPPRQNPTSGAIDAMALHQLDGGERLAHVATRLLGTPTRWREIAHASDIDDPFRVRPGRRLVVPSGS